MSVFNANWAKAEKELPEIIRKASDAALNNPDETMSAAFFDSMSQEAWNAAQTFRNAVGERDVKNIYECLQNSLRWEYIPMFGFPVISADDIRWIAEATGGAPMLEVGAGPGHLAFECGRFGLEVHPTEPYFGEENEWRWAKTREVEEISGKQAVLKYPGKNLLYSWPMQGEPHTGEILRAFTGETLVYIGEGPQGCTGNEEFHQILEDDFDITAARAIRQFPSIHDCIMVFRRKSRE